MRTAFTERSYLIESGQTMSGFADNIHSLELVNGRAWVTIEGVPFDFWLNCGERLSLPAGRLVVIESDGTDSRVQMRAPRGESFLAQLARKAARFFVRRPVLPPPVPACAGCTA